MRSQKLIASPTVHCDACHPFQDPGSTLARQWHRAVTGDQQTEQCTWLSANYDRWHNSFEAILSLTTSSSSFLPSIQCSQGSTGRNVSDTMAPLSINGHHWLADYITRYAALSPCSRLPLGLAGATYSAWQCENRTVILAD